MRCKTAFQVVSTTLNQLKVDEPEIQREFSMNGVGILEYLQVLVSNPKNRHTIHNPRPNMYTKAL